MRVLTVVGARPQFVKASAVSRCLASVHEEYLIHTGQHRDADLSQVFFDDLGLPPPAATLDLGTTTGGERICAMVHGLSVEIQARQPDVVLVYGDTDSTLAGALAARIASVPLAHVEAGLRSGVRRMPEEGNRIATDHLAQLLLCPTESAAEQLVSECAHGRVCVVGDVMLDVVQAGSATTAPLPKCVGSVEPGAYYAATLHRASNVDVDERLLAIVAALAQLELPVILACHPRTRAALERIGRAADHGSLRLIAPLRHAEILALVAQSRAVLTDSGGLQKEAYFLGVPCITLRDETEWRGTLDGGWNALVGADRRRLHAAIRALDDPRGPRDLHRFGDGQAAARVVTELEALGT